MLCVTKRWANAYTHSILSVWKTSFQIQCYLARSLSTFQAQSLQVHDTKSMINMQNVLIISESHCPKICKWHRNYAILIKYVILSCCLEALQAVSLASCMEMQVLADISSESCTSTSDNKAERPGQDTYPEDESLNTADKNELSNKQKCLKLCEVLALSFSSLVCSQFLLSFTL